MRYGRERTRVGRRLVAAALIATLGLSFPAAGCGGEKDAAARLEECRGAVARYVEGEGYLHFRQEKAYGLSQGESSFEQRIQIEGDSIFPLRQRYDYREVASSSQAPGETQENFFSYLTLDAGATAFVQGERLTQQTGVPGWIHYTPPAGQNRYFDLRGLVESLAIPEAAVESLGSEEMDGAPCAHLRYGVSGEQLLEMRLQDDPGLRERYEGLDLNQLVGDLTVEVWVGEEDHLPRRIVLRESVSLQGSTSTSDIRVELSAYHREPAVSIEQPAFFTEAE